VERLERWQTPPELWANFKRLAREARRHPTPAEERLWQALRRKSLGTRFRRQHSIGQFRVDLYCPRVRLAIEIDGSSHDDKGDYDAERTVHLEGRNIRVLRFTNSQVMGELGRVLETIEAALRS
jgi:very-short-patch-repair endonuclease